MRHTLKLYFMNSSTYPNPIPSEAPVITTHPSPYFALRSCLKERRFFFTHDSKEKENLTEEKLLKGYSSSLSDETIFSAF